MSKEEPIGQILRGVFSFPHPVNEVAARFVAGMVVILTSTIILSDVYWLLFVLAYGFLARVLTGPTLSPVGLLATRVLVPLLGNPKKLVAGPPKRFAQTIGLVFSVAALVLVYVFESTVVAEGVLIILVSFAILESVVGFCAGCFVFGYLMKWGIIPEETCKRCADIWSA
jgi:hypothetical protein